MWDWTVRQKFAEWLSHQGPYLVPQVVVLVSVRLRCSPVLLPSLHLPVEDVHRASGRQEPAPGALWEWHQRDFDGPRRPQSPQEASAQLARHCYHPLVQFRSQESQNISLKRCVVLFLSSTAGCDLSNPVLGGKPGTGIRVGSAETEPLNAISRSLLCPTWFAVAK